VSRLTVRLLSAAWFACFVLISCSDALPQETFVSRVVDGDTIELIDGRLVRYIGIDAPEIRRKIAGHWVMDPQPMGLEAATFNRTLVEHQRVRLEYDIETHDRYGRLLAYVYVGDVMVNAELLRSGLAHLLTIPPDVKYAERFRELAASAHAAHRGVWATR